MGTAVKTSRTQMCTLWPSPLVWNDSFEGGKSERAGSIQENTGQHKLGGWPNVLAIPEKDMKWKLSPIKSMSSYMLPVFKTRIKLSCLLCHSVQITRTLNVPMQQPSLLHKAMIPLHFTPSVMNGRELGGRTLCARVKYMDLGMLYTSTMADL